MSIVIALGVAHILSGLGTALANRSEVEHSPLLYGWSLVLLSIHVGFWFNFWRLHEIAEWGRPLFWAYFISAALLFLASRTLLPVVSAAANTDLRGHFERARAPFFSLLALYWAWAITTGALLLTNAPSLGTVRQLQLVALAVVAGAGVFIHSRPWQYVHLAAYAALFAVLHFGSTRPLS